MFVHFGGAGDPVSLALCDQCPNLRTFCYIPLCQILYVVSTLALPQREVTLGDVQKVPNFLAVKLEDGDFQLKLDVLWRFLYG